MAVYSLDAIRTLAERAARQHGHAAPNPFPSEHAAHDAFAQALCEALAPAEA